VTIEGGGGEADGAPEVAVKGESTIVLRDGDTDTAMVAS
jgi:hypothetical protein